MGTTRRRGRVLRGVCKSASKPIDSHSLFDHPSFRKPTMAAVAEQQEQYPQDAVAGPIYVDTQHEDFVHDAQMDFYGAKLATCSSGASHVCIAFLSLFFASVAILFLAY